MEDLLFLTPRIPYPPNKGDKLRSWNIIKHLKQRYNVHLGCFVDNEDDWKHVPFIQSQCTSSHFARLDGPRKLFRAGKAILTGKPISTAYFEDKALIEWVHQTITATNPDVAFFFSSEMADFVPLANEAGTQTIMDFVDMDSAKWQEYGEVRSWPQSWVYRREGKLVHELELRSVEEADHAVFVSAEEAQLFNATLAPGVQPAGALPNGVDCDYFSPSQHHETPFQPNDRPIVFTGVMNYWPNIDSVCWFADEVLPTIRDAVPEACFYIVGMNPAPTVEELGKRSGIVVTGSVADVRPYVANSAFAVAPLRVARGVQNKVIEAMAMGKPVLATPQAAEGLGDMRPEELAVLSDAQGFARHAIALLKGDVNLPDGRAARAKVETDFSWEGQLSRLDAILAGEGN